MLADIGRQSCQESRILVYDCLYHITNKVHTFANLIWMFRYERGTLVTERFLRSGPRGPQR